MKIRVKVHYVPSNILYLGDVVEMKEAELEELSLILQDVNKLSYFKLPLKESIQYISPKILQESVIIIEEVK